MTNEEMIKDLSRIMDLLDTHIDLNQSLNITQMEVAYLDIKRVVGALKQQSVEDSIAINDWLSSFNTDSATVCFTEIQKLKEQIGTLNNCTNCKYKDLRNYNYPCVNCSNNYTNMFENKEN